MGVSTSDILANNSSLSTSYPPDPTAVFVGGTAGIGLGALQALLKHTARPTVYLVGRSPSKLATLIDSLKANFNKNATLIPIHASDLTLVKDAAAAAADIARQTSRIDLLIMTAGYVTFTGREEHPAEGIDKVTAVRYYSRMAFVLGLQTQLQAAEAPRIISVLAGGKEGIVWPEDLLLREEGHYGTGIAGRAASAAAAMNSLFFEHVATLPGWEKAVFAHVYPGLCKTKLEFRGLGAVTGGLLKYVGQPMVGVLGKSLEEAGERVLFVGTSGWFRRLGGGEEGSDKDVNKGCDGKVGSGVYLVQGDTAIAKPTKEFVTMTGDGMGGVVYNHTVEVLEKIQKGQRA